MNGASIQIGGCVMSVEGCMAKITKHMWLLAIVICVIGLCPTFSAVAFAQTYTNADNPHGPLPIYAWVSGTIIVGIVTGGGIITIVRKK